MIGPSSGTGSMSSGDMADGQLSKISKKRILEELDMENFCEEVCQSGRKRYVQEMQSSPMELMGSSDENGLTRLEVLVVDGTGCTWTTTMGKDSNLQELANCLSTNSSAASFVQDNCHQLENSQDVIRNVGFTAGDALSQQTLEDVYWEASEPIVTAPATIITANKKFIESSSTRPVLPSRNDHMEDQENGNLSWLLDFKLDPFIESAEERTCGSAIKDNHCNAKNKLYSKSSGSFSDGRRIDHFPMQQESDSSYTSDNRNNLSRFNGPKKPPFTYTELIEHALQERGELTVSAIYQWISEHFPYYKSNDDRWKNSVRHNLSINPHFRKGSKAPHGAGHLWAIANRGDMKPRPIITGSTTLKIDKSRQTIKNLCENGLRINGNIISEAMMLDEVEAATASITQQLSEEETDSIVNSVTLEHCAGEILSGVKREVEVQYIVPMVMPSTNDNDISQHDQQNETSEFDCNTIDTDFLNPISKEVVAEECGLIGESYLVTDLNPAALGLNMVEPEMIAPENLFGEELSFQLYELTSPSQLQSA
ncbi:uncharacterized protein [Prorops nasuta]|uniref:uncharacterized protein isoform X2 n=1 Tax=Prorops nasuta TaxID=863751 RepID=UPI0034CDE110